MRKLFAVAVILIPLALASAVLVALSPVQATHDFSFNLSPPTNDSTSSLGRFSVLAQSINITRTYESNAGFPKSPPSPTPPPGLVSGKPPREIVVDLSITGSIRGTKPPTSTTPLLEGDVITELPALAQAAVGTNDDTAHYLLGKTLIVQVFVDTSDDRWTDADRQTAIGQLINAVNWLKGQSPQPSLVDFNVGKYYDVTVTRTITEAYGDFGWIDEAAASITPEDGDGDGVHTDSLVNYLRDRYHFNNTIVIYQPHMRGRSYAWRHEMTQILGSITVVYFRPPPPSLPWQVNSEYVYAHELLHVLGACDEYVEDGSCNQGIDCGLCDNPWIDQKYDNSNCELPSCPANLPCIMRHPDTEHATCEFTQGSIGWGDADNDGILDPLDTGPPPSIDSATFLSHITLPDGSTVPSGQALVKTWR